MKRHTLESIDPRVKVRSNNLQTMLISYVTLMLLVGIQMGLIVGMRDLNISPLHSTHRDDAVLGAGVERQFIGYEYRTLTVHADMASVYADGYSNFGWEQEGPPSAASPTGMVTLKFKRDRKIRNKAELTRLQRQFDACAEELTRLERSKTQNASIVAFTVGLIGCGFMAGSVFAVTAAPPILWLCVLLAIPGFAGWVAPYFLYTRICDEKTVTVNGLADKKYDEIYEVCEKANHLLG